MSKELQTKNQEQKWQISLDKFSDKVIIKQGLLTLESVVACDSPHLSVLEKKCGELPVKAMLTELIVDLINFFSVGKSMGKEKIASTINLIVTEFDDFKMEEFALCFKNRKMGIYGELYDRLDGSIIISDLNQFRRDKEEWLHSQHEIKKKADSLSDLNTGEFMPDDIKEQLNSILPLLPFKSKEYDSINPSEIDRQVNLFMREFDTIHSKTENRREKTGAAIRLIEYKGKIINNIDYIETRITELKNNQL